MIPNNQWSDRAELKKFKSYGKVRPSYASTNPYSISLGPEVLSVAGAVLTEAWWLFEYTEGVVKLYKLIDNEWQYHSDLFTPVGCISMSACFDQLGKPLVFYDTGSELRLWWYDPTIPAHTVTVFGVGSHPKTTFDMKYDVSNSTSDVLLFYVRDGVIYYRVQRDRYEVEYATPVTDCYRKLISADMAVDYRLQLIYR